MLDKKFGRFYGRTKSADFAWQTTDFCWPILLADTIGQLRRSSDIRLRLPTGIPWQWRRQAKLTSVGKAVTLRLRLSTAHTTGRVTASFYARHLRARISYGNSVCPSVSLSVRHDPVRIQGQVGYRHRVFTIWQPSVSSFLWGNLVSLGNEIPVERWHQRGVPP